MTAAQTDVARELLDDLEVPCNFRSEIVPPCDRTADVIGTWSVAGKPMIREPLCDLHRVFIQRHLERCRNCAAIELTFTSEAL